MLINLRNALMAGKRLPYDAEVEYLESSGTQYINTGVVPTTTKTEITFSTPTPPSSGYMCGSFNANNNRYYPAAFSGSSIRYINLINAANTVISQYTNDGNVHTVVYNATGGACYFDGVAAGALDTTALTASNPIYLFCTSTSTGASGLVSGRIYSCKLYDANGTLVRDYIPVRKGTVGYLYDRVSGKLFGNAGTGDFVLGPDVVPVEYIESHGTEYINTGIVATNAHGVRIDIATAQKSGNANTRIFGTHEGNTRFGFAIFGTDEPTGNDAFFGWNAATSFVATIPQRFVASLNYQNDRKAIFNGTTYISSLGTLGSMTLPFYLLNANYDGAPFWGQYVIGKLYGAEVSVGSSITNRYKPVRVGTEGAMMDVLTRRIYRNAGTGAFTYGNDLKYPIPAE